MNFMTQYIFQILKMQAALVEDKVELILHGGYIVIYQFIIDIFQIQNMVDLVQLIIVLFQWHYHQKVKMLIIQVIALLKAMEVMALELHIE